MMSPIIRDSEIHEKTAPAPAAAECPARKGLALAGSPHSPQPSPPSGWRGSVGQCLMMLAFNTITCDRTCIRASDRNHLVTMCHFVSTFAKVRCVLRNPASINELRHGRQYQPGAQGHKKSLPDRDLEGIRLEFAVRSFFETGENMYRPYLPGACFQPARRCEGSRQAPRD